MSESPDADEIVTETPNEEETPPEIKHEGFIALDKHQKDVNNQHKKFQDEKRSRISSEAESERLRQQIAELKGSKTDLTIPDAPDQFATDYEEKIAARDAAIRRNAEHDGEVKRLAEDKERNDKVVADAAEEENKAQVAVFDSNMLALGLNPVEVKASADKIIGFGISEGLTDFVLEDPDGPLMVQYLEQNPVELEAMNKMSSLGLFNHINSTVRAKAQLLKPKTSNAPNPPNIPTGGGVPETEQEWEKGAKYS